MKHTYKTLIHNDFRSRLRDRLVNQTRLYETLTKCLDCLYLDPLSASVGVMRGVRDQTYKRDLHHMHVGGGKGHRLIYWVLKEDFCVLPTFLSPITKEAGFRYKPRHEWQDDSWDILAEYNVDRQEFGDTVHNYAHFSIWNGNL